MTDAGTLRVIPLGGLGEIGRNMMLYEHSGAAIAVDVGLLFPDTEHLGVDIIVPEITYLTRDPSLLQAVFLTHGHEDHIGALPFLLREINVPVFCSTLTRGLVEVKLREHKLLEQTQITVLEPGQRVTVGPFTVEAFMVSHSIPDAGGFIIETPLGDVVHTGDFKIDQTPLDGQHFDLPRLAELGSRGVLALFADSTNVDRKGVAGSEVDVIEGFEELFTSAPGKLVVATFSSSIYRMQVLVDLAVQFERKVAFLGRSLVRNVEIAQRLGYLRVPSGVQIRDADVSRYAPQDVLCVTTGSQGEPMAALPRIAIDDHRHVRLTAGDVVVLSARAIPGNEKAIGRVMSHIARRGADVITESMRRVHVSGSWTMSS
jgi:ribonuclease J